MAFDTPVVLIIYNRPDLTEKVFEAITKLKPAKLFIIADGPKHTQDSLLCDQTRQIVQSCNWDVEVQTNYSEINMGMTDRTISGLDWVFGIVETAIIVEDDCLPDPSFFKFCQELLSYYWDNNKVMYIAGSNLGQHLSIETSYVFTKWAMFWGWATWARAWRKFNSKLDTWQNHKEALRKNINPQQQRIFEFISQHVSNNRITWDVSWNTDVWLNDGIGIVPVVNMITNIGFDKRGTVFTFPDSRYANLSLGKTSLPLVHPVSIDINEGAVMETAFFDLAQEYYSKRVEDMIKYGS